MITQKDIANRLSVSRALVSAALNGTPGVSETTRVRIQAFAEELGYLPNRSAQLMRGGKSGVIGLISSASVLYTNVLRLRAAAETIYAQGYGLLSSELLWSEQGIERAVECLINAQVEGVLLMSAGAAPAYTHEMARLRRIGIPVVSLGHIVVDGIPLVASDYFQGMRDVTNHALATGYRRIAFLSVAGDQPDGSFDRGISERLRGFRQAVTDAGLDTDAVQVLHEPMDADFDGYAPGKSGMLRLLSGMMRPQAVLCSNDQIALGAIKVCTEIGLRVPEDIAITGFDDSPLAQYFTPRLTTVAQPASECGRKAAELLLDLVQKKENTIPDIVRLPCRLVVRESC